MKRLLIPGHSFIRLFPSGYEALAFSHQLVTFSLSADMDFWLCSSWFTTFPMLCRPLPPFFLLVYSLAVLDLRWNAPCRVMSFLVPMSIYFRSSLICGTPRGRCCLAGTLPSNMSSPAAPSIAAPLSLPVVAWLVLEWSTSQPLQRAPVRTPSILCVRQSV